MVSHWCLKAFAVSRMTMVVSVGVMSISLPGCERVQSIVEDVKSEIGDSPEATVTTDSAPAEPAPVAAPAPQPSLTPVPTPPDPDQLIAGFQQLQPFQIGDADLRKLADVPEAAARITKLDLRGNSETLTTEGMMLIAEFPNLQQLTLVGRKVPAAVISAVGEKTQLRELDLTNAPVDPIVANALSGLSHLQRITLDGTPAGDSAAAAVSSLPIESLSLSGTPLTDAGLQEISKISTLKELVVSNTSVTGLGFRPLKKLNLVKLNASSTQFGVEGLVSIRGMKSLEELHLFAAGIVEQPKAKVFTTLPNLRVLNLNSNVISGPGMHQLFKGMKNLEELYLQSTQADDSGLAALVGCRKLKLVDVGKTRCTLLGARALKERLPECTIHFAGGSI